jgi:nucleoside-diphosphate-sugar epimerase
MSSSLILVTGAAGRLGTVLCPRLVQAGKSIRATDWVCPAGAFSPLVQANLLHPAACARLVEKADVLVHLGNHSSPSQHSAEQTCDENIRMNRLIFQAAIDAGVKKIIFASTHRVLGGPHPSENCCQLSSYLPLDENSPVSAVPESYYSVSKMVGEQMLAMNCLKSDVAGITLRLPPLAYISSAPARMQEYHLSDPRFFFSYLTFLDAADLIKRVIDADLPGYRVYLPASRRTSVPRPVADLVREYYPQVPLRKPVAELSSLIDISTITRETGWEPLDQGLPEPLAPPSPAPAPKPLVQRLRGRLAKLARKLRF